MDGTSFVVLVSGFLPTWLMLAKVYYNLGKIEQNVKDLAKIIENGFKEKKNKKVRDKRK